MRNILWLGLLCVLYLLTSSEGHFPYISGGYRGNHPSFLPSSYRVRSQSSENQTSNDQNQELWVRQVPGDGGCLFHSLAVCVVHLATGQHVCFDSKTRQLSNKLREISINLLSDRKSKFYIENDFALSAEDIVESTAKHYGLTPSDYLEVMRDPRSWGGGPEIVALSNYFKRPIHIYELCHRSFLYFFGRRFELRSYAKFGSPTFDHRDPIRILCADGRFPNITPGYQIMPGDHFSPLFPEDRLPVRLLRGGEREEVDGQAYRYPAKYSIDELIKIARTRNN
jgi:hypothetical protein